MPYPVLAIANEFLTRGFDEQRLLTHMQVQKLCYLTHGWGLAADCGALIEDQFEAWRFGPVVRKLYDSLKGYGKGNVLRRIRWGDDTPLADDEELPEAFVQLNQSERELLDYVWNSYKEYHAFQLSALTHVTGTPWEVTYVRGQNRPISNDVIRDYFVKLWDKAATAEVA